MSKGLPVNWDFIEPLYRTGGLSNYEIARQYELTHINSDKYKPTVTEAAIRDRAKRKKWDRDLTEKVRQRTEAKLLREGLRKCEDGGEAAKASDEDIVEAAAETRAQVVKLHRRDLTELESLEADIIRRLREDETQVIVGWYEGAASEHHVKMGLLERCKAYRELVTARSKRILLSRISWGLDDKNKLSETKAVEVHLNLAGNPEENDQ